VQLRLLRSLEGTNNSTNRKGGGIGMGMRYQTVSKASNQMAIRLGYKDQDYTTFAELVGTKDDLIDVLLTGLFVFAVGAFIVALLRG